ncbi:hypothetical protein [Methylocystis sp. Sn-Cys]|uniref:hypothetical protein n=1 Tax=Methylocystis sp. Sn-Cys TaxID=1701263 RepID=UPI00192320D7|nr:hypothetical protein [Methylocystis sp. Sn-Cys]MBL1258009.1 hypothetical protein [Methylocystis sp. Sn-Cys]
MIKSHRDELIVALLRAGVRLNARFGDPRRSPNAEQDLPGWRRDKGDGEFEWWILPSHWRVIFEPDVDAIDAAQTIEALGLLRRQDDGNLQAVVKVNGKTTRVYAIKGKALAEWRPTPQSYGGYGIAAAQPLGALVGSSTTPADPAHPANLSALLEHGVALALQKGMEVLGMSLAPADRQFAALLRSQTAFAGHLINAQVRVDETRMRQKKADNIERLISLLEEERQRQRELGY